MAAQQDSIEFLPQEDWEKTRFGRVLKWALTVGRYIVIFTELIVIGAFLSRFKLDRDLTDLHDEVKGKVAVVKSQAEFEKEFRSVQKKILNIDDLNRNRFETEALIEELAKILPVNVTLSDLNIKGEKVGLTATALSESGLSTFLRNLETSSRFQNITLSDITSGKTKTVGITFTLGVETAKK